MKGGYGLDKNSTADILPCAPSADDMDTINRFTKKTLTQQEVYTFGVVLCDNEIDRDYERFDTEALGALAKMFVGKTGICDHDMRSANQVSRLYKAELVVDNARRNSLGEPYAYIKAMAYMPRNERNSALIADIDAGIKKEASVGCSVRNVVCSECGADLRRGMCEHIKGKHYGGRLCHAVLKDPADAYEWSFVAVPAQPAAGVTKSFTNKGRQELNNILKAIKTETDAITLSADELKNLRAEIETLEKSAAEGRLYRERLLSDAVRLGMLAMPQISGESLKSICGKLSANELCELKSVFSQNAEKRMPVSPQLAGEKKDCEAQNNEFKI
jgi:hypothetical protein